jgi:TRAP-type uncharacterized transport system substrate-binding protein
MKKWTLAAIVIFTLGIFVNVNAAQLIVATGGTGGTYSTMFKELSNQCGSSDVLVEKNSSGSIENINLLMGNKVNMAFTQMDVLKFKSNTENLDNIRTLFTLHSEEVHFIAKDDPGIKVGGYAGFGGTKVVFNTINDLQGYTVGAAGGSFITLQVIRLQTEIKYNVQEFKSNKDLLVALEANQIQAACVVGGAPMPILEVLGNTYKVLPIGDVTVNKLKNVYNPARVSYPNMNSSGVPTVAIDAIVVTREYKTPAFIEAFRRFRQCLVDNVDLLKETTGTHPKWQDVNPESRGKWAWYELPTVTGKK